MAAERGASNVRLLLAILGVVVLVVLGWVLFRRDGARTVPEAIADPHYNDTKYLQILEIGIQFALSQDINDAYYYISPDSHVYFSVERYNNKEGMEGCTARGRDGNGGGLMALSSAKLGEQKAGKVWTQQELVAVHAKRVGTTYYWFDDGPVPCYDPDKISTETSEVRSISQFKESFKKQQQTISRL